MNRVITTALMVYSVYWDWNEYDRGLNLNAYNINDSFETAIEAAKECYERYQEAPITEDFEKSLRETPHQYEDEDILIRIEEEPIYTRRANLYQKNQP